MRQQIGPVAGLSFVLLLLCACGGAEDTGEAATASAERPLQNVKIAAAAPAPAGEVSQAVGTVRLDSEVQLGFTTPGRIAEIRVRSGDSVSRGQTLASLDPDTVSADLASASAEAERARRELERNSELFAEGWVTRSRIDDLEAAARAADARVRAASFAVRTARIAAPSDGVVLERLAEPGQIIDAGAPVLALGRADQGFVLRVPLTDTQAANLEMGLQAQAFVPALGEEPIPARLTELAGRADPQTGTFAAEFSLAARPGLRSGQIGSVALPQQQSAGAVQAVEVPASALVNARAGQAVVWVFDPRTQTVTARTVVPGELGRNGVQIAEGLRSGESVVVANLENLTNGDRVAAR